MARFLYCLIAPVPMVKRLDEIVKSPELVELARRVEEQHTALLERINEMRQEANKFYTDARQILISASKVPHTPPRKKPDAPVKFPKPPVQRYTPADFSNLTDVQKTSLDALAKEHFRAIKHEDILNGIHVITDNYYSLQDSAIALGMGRASIDTATSPSQKLLLKENHKISGYELLRYSQRGTRDRNNMDFLSAAKYLGTTVERVTTLVSQGLLPTVDSVTINKGGLMKVYDMVHPKKGTERFEYVYALLVFSVQESTGLIPKSKDSAPTPIKGNGIAHDAESSLDSALKILDAPKSVKPSVVATKIPAPKPTGTTSITPPFPAHPALPRPVVQPAQTPRPYAGQYNPSPSRPTQTTGSSNHSWGSRPRTDNTILASGQRGSSAPTIPKDQTGWTLQSTFSRYKYLREYVMHHDAAQHPDSEYIRVRQTFSPHPEKKNKQVVNYLLHTGDLARLDLALKYIPEKEVVATLKSNWGDAVPEALEMIARSGMKTMIYKNKPVFPTGAILVPQWEESTIAWLEREVKPLISNIETFVDRKTIAEYIGSKFSDTVFDKAVNSGQITCIVPTQAQLYNIIQSYVVFKAAAAK